METLDLLGMRAGTDKSRLRWDYLRHYQRMFSPFVDQPITVVEIGVHQGASLRIWEQFFPLARIVGIDLEPSRTMFARGRVVIEIGSQCDADFLKVIASKYAPSIIIDDGSHIPEHQVFTFEHLFDSLTDGGVYVVEDLSANVADLAVERFMLLHQNILQQRSKGAVARSEIIPGAMALWKRPAPDELDGNFAALTREVDQAERSGEALYYLAEYMRSHGAPLDDALSMARKASALDPANPWVHFEIGKTLHAMGRRAEAVSALQDALRVHPWPIGIIRQYLDLWSRG